jgi:ATP-dependent protease ClpP protease subunit
MPNDILLYTSINSYTSSEFITKLDEAGDNDVTIRINADGGDPEYGWGMIAKLSEQKGKVNIKVDRKCHSMYAFMLCYVTDAEGTDVSEYGVHRAAYPSWYESDPDFFDESARERLNRVNALLRKALEAKINMKEFEAITGVTMKQLFSLDDRITVMLTAIQAKKIGLINRIIKLTPQKSAEIKSLMHAEMAAHYSDDETVVEAVEKPKIELNKSKNMNLAEFKAAHPSVYAEAVAEGRAAGIAEGKEEEKDRVEAALVFMEADPTGVKALIESGKKMTAKQSSEFLIKLTSKNAVAGIEADSAKTVTTAADATKEQTAKEKENAAFEAELDKKLNLGKK